MNVNVNGCVIHKHFKSFEAANAIKISRPLGKQMCKC